MGSTILVSRHGCGVATDGMYIMYVRVLLEYFVK